MTDQEVAQFLAGQANSGVSNSTIAYNANQAGISSSQVLSGLQSAHPELYGDDKAPYAAGTIQSLYDSWTPHGASQGNGTVYQDYLGPYNAGNPSTPTATKFSDPGKTQPMGDFGNNAAPQSNPPPNLRDTFGQMYQNQDYTGMQSAINQYGLDGAWAKQNYGLSDSDLGLAKTLGVNFGGNPTPSQNSANTSSAPTLANVTQPNGSAANPYSAVKMPQQNISGATQGNDPRYPILNADSPDWMKHIYDPKTTVTGDGEASSTTTGIQGVYKDPATGKSYSAIMDYTNDPAGHVGGYYESVGPSQKDPRLITAKVLDINGNDTGKRQDVGELPDFMVDFFFPIAVSIGAGAVVGPALMGGTLGAETGVVGGLESGVAPSGAVIGGPMSSGALTGTDLGTLAAGGAAPGAGITMGADGSTTFGAVDSSLVHTADSGLVPGTGLQAPAGVGTNLTGPLTGAPGLTATPGTGLSLAATTGAPGLVPPAGALTGNLLNGIAGGSGTLLGANGLAGLTTLSTGLSVPTGLGTAATGAAGSGGTGTGGPSTNGPALSNSGFGDLLKTLTGVLSAANTSNSQKDSANNMLGWLREQQAKIDNLYAPGSPEYNLLEQQMRAKDAAAGRNSQYGVRAVDLAAKIAQIKAQYTAQLTSGIAGNMQTAFNQNASANDGLSAILGNLTKTDSSGNSTLSNTLSKFF